jgi:hypothetical protein
VDQGSGQAGSSRPGTLVVLEPGGGPWSPQEGRVLWFGRNRPDVHICVGPDDPGVSRRHGSLEFSAGRWWVRTLGSRPVHVGGVHVLRRGDEPVPLTEGRTSLLVEGADPRDLHLVRVRVVGPAEQRPHTVGSGTVPVRCFRLESTERLVMTVLAQRHLLRCPDPQPLTAREAADELVALQPAVGWTQKKVEHLVKKVRDRLSGQGVGGLVPEPGRTGFDSAYRRNLIDALLGTGTLGADDLSLLDAGG